MKYLKAILIVGVPIILYLGGWWETGLLGLMGSVVYAVLVFILTLPAHFQVVIGIALAIVLLGLWARGQIKMTTKQTGE